MSYIAFEGGEGSGKSTQAQILAERLGAVLTREPGATDLGSKIRQLLLADSGIAIDRKAEVLLMAADRVQHISEVVQPALETGRMVVSDRSVYSSLAYQGFGRELGIEYVRQINRLSLEQFWPEVVVLIDITLEEANKRLDRDLDRFESAGTEFHQRVLDGYQKLAADDPGRWVVVSGLGDIDAVAERVWSSLPASCKPKSG